MQPEGDQIFFGALQRCADRVAQIAGLLAFKPRGISQEGVPQLIVSGATVRQSGTAIRRAKVLFFDPRDPIDAGVPCTLGSQSDGKLDAFLRVSRRRIAAHKLYGNSTMQPCNS